MLLTPGQVSTFAFFSWTLCPKWGKYCWMDSMISPLLQAHCANLTNKLSAISVVLKILSSLLGHCSLFCAVYLKLIHEWPIKLTPGRITYFSWLTSAPNVTEDHERWGPWWFQQNTSCITQHFVNKDHFKDSAQYSVTSYPKMWWLETAILLCSQPLWVRNSQGA